MNTFSDCIRHSLLFCFWEKIDCWEFVKYVMSKIKWDSKCERCHCDCCRWVSRACVFIVKCVVDEIKLIDVMIILYWILIDVDVINELLYVKIVLNHEIKMKIDLMKEIKFEELLNSLLVTQHHIHWLEWFGEVRVRL